MPVSQMQVTKLRLQLRSHPTNKFWGQEILSVYPILPRVQQSIFTAFTNHDLPLSSTGYSLVTSEKNPGHLDTIYSADEEAFQNTPLCPSCHTPFLPTCASSYIAPPPYTHPPATYRTNMRLQMFTTEYTSVLVLKVLAHKAWLLSSILSSIWGLDIG